MSYRYCLYCISFIWCIWLAFAIFQFKLEVKENLIIQKTGVATSAKCIESRSVVGVRFRVEYHDEGVIRDDFISLPPGIHCDEELLDHFNMTKIQIDTYNNHYLGVIVDGLLIRDVDDGIQQFTDKNIVIYFSGFVVIILSLALFGFGRAQKDS